MVATPSFLFFYLGVVIFLFFVLVVGVYGLLRLSYNLLAKNKMEVRKQKNLQHLFVLIAFISGLLLIAWVFVFR